MPILVRNGFVHLVDVNVALFINMPVP